MATLYSETDVTRVEKIISGLAVSKNYIISLTLDGKLNLWDTSKIEDKQAPSIILDGHQNYIYSIVYNNTNKLFYSGDADGRISKQNYSQFKNY